MENVGKQINFYLNTSEDFYMDSIGCTQHI